MKSFSKLTGVCILAVALGTAFNGCGPVDPREPTAAQIRMLTSQRELNEKMKLVSARIKAQPVLSSEDRFNSPALLLEGTIAALTKSIDFTDPTRPLLEYLEAALSAKVLTTVTEEAIDSSKADPEFLALFKGEVVGLEPAIAEVQAALADLTAEADDQIETGEVEQFADTATPVGVPGAGILSSALIDVREIEPGLAQYSMDCRWQAQGIGHTIVIKNVNLVTGAVLAQVQAEDLAEVSFEVSAPRTRVGVSAYVVNSSGDTKTPPLDGCTLSITHNVRKGLNAVNVSLAKSEALRTQLTTYEDNSADFQAEADRLLDGASANDKTFIKALVSIVNADSNVLQSARRLGRKSKTYMQQTDADTARMSTIDAQFNSLQKAAQSQLPGFGPLMQKIKTSHDMAMSIIGNIRA